MRYGRTFRLRIGRQGRQEGRYRRTDIQRLSRCRKHVQTHKEESEAEDKLAPVLGLALACEDMYMQHLLQVQLHIGSIVWFVGLLAIYLLIANQLQPTTLLQ